MIGWLTFGTASAAAIAWAFLKSGSEYRHPITESDIKTMREEAERAASLTEARCPWPLEEVR